MKLRFVWTCLLVFCLSAAVGAAEAAKDGTPFICKEMWLQLTLPAGTEAEYYPNDEIGRPLLAIADSRTLEPAAEIIWFRDIRWPGTALDFVTDWLVKDNVVDQVLPVEDSVVRRLKPERKVEIWKTDGERHIKAGEYWQLDTGIGAATLVRSESKTDAGTIRKYNAYVKRRGSILWISCGDADRFARVLESLRCAKL